MKTSDQIRHKLLERNMKIRELAEAYGINQPNMSNKLKKNDFKESELRKIAKILNCDLVINFEDKSTED